MTLGKFGPKTADDYTVGRECPACHEPFEVGCYTTLIALGPGSDPEQRQLACDGRAYNAVALEVHYACATGEPDQVGG